MTLPGPVRIDTVLTGRAAALRNRTKAGSLWFAPSGPMRGVGGGAVVPAGPVPTYTQQEVLAPAPGQVASAPVVPGHVHQVPTGPYGATQVPTDQPAPTQQPYPEGGYFAQWQGSQGDPGTQDDQGSDGRSGQSGTPPSGPSGS